MASIVKDPNGRKRVLFVDQDGNRKTIRLGKCSQKQAETFKVKVESLIVGRFSTVEPETARWVADLPDDMHAKLTAVGLVQPRASMRLAEFVDGYIAERADATPNTLIVLRQSRQKLIAFFGPDKPLREITEADAESWRLYLVRLGLAEATIRKCCGNAKQFFRAAVKRRLVPADPFNELESSAKANKKREYFVSRPDTQKVIEACPDAQWRLIFALCRYGGVRCPSEVLTLKWSDVNWGANRILVHSPKTEHHEGGESRLVPLFPELAPYLHEVFAEAEPGDGYVITRYRQRNANLRTQLQRIIRKAGLKPWPRLFQNLRSTRETELTESFPLHVVTAWIGNSQLVARKHYLQVTDEHFARAAQNPAHAAQKATQHPVARDGISLSENQQESPENAETLISIGAGTCFEKVGMGDEGVEPSTC